MSLVWSPGFNGVTDPDAQTYIAAVEAADGQAIEGNVAYAINDFVVGCKDDGIWDAIKASCILAGARTLSGALVPLKGTAPTNVNFVSGDYNRETGLKGGNGRYINSNRGYQADPEDDFHASTYVTEAATGLSGGFYIGSQHTVINYGGSGSIFYNRHGTPGGTVSGIPLGLIGHSRNNGNDYIARVNAANTTISKASTSYSTTAGDHTVIGSTNNKYVDGRLSFYSIGEHLDLALLDARVSTLMTDIGAAIP